MKQGDTRLVGNRPDHRQSVGRGKPPADTAAAQGLRGGQRGDAGQHGAKACEVVPIGLGVGSQCAGILEAGADQGLTIPHRAGVGPTAQKAAQTTQRIGA